MSISRTIESNFKIETMEFSDDAPAAHFLQRGPKVDFIISGHRFNGTSAKDLYYLLSYLKLRTPFFLVTDDNDEWIQKHTQFRNFRVVEQENYEPRLKELIRDFMDFDSKNFDLLPQKLKILRKALKLSQVSFAELFGVSDREVSLSERNVKEINSSYFMNVLKFSNIECDHWTHSSIEAFERELREVRPILIENIKRWQNE